MEKDEILKNMVVDSNNMRFGSTPMGKTKTDLFDNLAETYESKRKRDKIDFYIDLFKHPSQYENGFSGGKIELDKDNPDWLRFLARSSVLSKEEREWLKNISIKDILNNIRNTEDKIKEPQIYLAIAVLFANFESWKDPYRWLEWEKNSWVWIKALLGKKHYNQFLKDKQECIDKIQEDVTMKKPLQRLLVRWEIDYLINNIRWSNPQHIFFWFHEWIDDSSTKLISNKLIEKLEDCIWSYFNESSNKLSIQN